MAPIPKALQRPKPVLTKYTVAEANAAIDDLCKSIEAMFPILEYMSTTNIKQSYNIGSPSSYFKVVTEDITKLYHHLKNIKDDLPLETSLDNIFAKSSKKPGGNFGLNRCLYACLGAAAYAGLKELKDPPPIHDSTKPFNSFFHTMRIIMELYGPKLKKEQLLEAFEAEKTFHAQLEQSYPMLRAYEQARENNRIQPDGSFFSVQMKDTRQNTI